MYSTLLVTILAYIRVCSSETQQCFDYDGRSVNAFPCNPNAAVSACCQPKMVCASNLYCKYGPGGDGEKYEVKEVGYCTDKTWQDPACPFQLGQ